MSLIIFCLASTCALFSQQKKNPPPDIQQQHVTLQQVQQQLDQAESDFKKSEEMFNPWYTGPLITPSATVVPLGVFSTQPYLYVIDTFGSYDKKRKFQKSKQGSQISVNPVGGPCFKNQNRAPKYRLIL